MRLGVYGRGGIMSRIIFLERRVGVGSRGAVVGVWKGLDWGGVGCSVKVFEFDCFKILRRNCFWW